MIQNKVLWAWTGLAVILLVVIALGVSFVVSARSQAASRQAQAREAAMVSVVPDVRGMTALQASDRIKSAQLTLGKIDYDPNASGAPGAVVAINPNAGTKANKGAMVVVTVAGPQPIAVPNFVGLDLSAAQGAAAAVGLNLVQVTQKSSAKAGSVLSQQPAAGAELAPGSSVNIWVSQGSTAQAQSSDGTYTPKKGSAERTALMDACRIYLGYSGQFIVNELKVKGTRAFANVTPYDNPSWGSEGLYLLRNGSGWVVSNDSRTAAARGSFVSEDSWLNNK